MRDPGLAGDQPRTPARALARLANHALELLRRAARRVMRPARAIQRPPSARSLLGASVKPAPLPPMRCAVRGRETGCRLPLAHPQIDHQEDKLATTCRSEPSVSVNRHPGPPGEQWFLGRSTASGAARTSSQPLTTSPGTTTRRSPGPPWSTARALFAGSEAAQCLA